MGLTPPQATRHGQIAAPGPSLAWLVNVEGFGRPRTDPADAPLRYARWLDELPRPLREGRYRSLAQLAGFLRSKNPRLTPDRAEFVAGA